MKGASERFELLGRLVGGKVDGLDVGIEEVGSTDGVCSVEEIEDVGKGLVEANGKVVVGAGG